MTETPITGPRWSEQGVLDEDHAWAEARGRDLAAHFETEERMSSPGWRKNAHHNRSLGESERVRAQATITAANRRAVVACVTLMLGALGWVLLAAYVASTFWNR